MLPLPRSSELWVLGRADPAGLLCSLSQSVELSIGTLRSPVPCYVLRTEYVRINSRRHNETADGSSGEFGSSTGCF